MAKQEDLLHSPEAKRLLENREALRSLLRSPETARLMALLDRSSGDLQSAANAAAGGDPERLVRMVQQVMTTPEGARTVQDIQNRFSK